MGLCQSLSVSANRQRNCGAEDVVGIVVPLGGDEPVGIGAIAFCHKIRVVSDRKFGYPPGSAIAPAVSIRSPRCPHISLAGSFSCQPSLSIITLGVFLRKHVIAEVRNDALTKSLIGPGWDDLVEPKQSVILEARQ